MPSKKSKSEKTQWKKAEKAEKAEQRKKRFRNFFFWKRDQTSTAASTANTTSDVEQTNSTASPRPDRASERTASEACSAEVIQPSAASTSNNAAATSTSDVEQASSTAPQHPDGTSKTNVPATADVIESATADITGTATADAVRTSASESAQLPQSSVPSDKPYETCRRECCSFSADEGEVESDYPEELETLIVAQLQVLQLSQSLLRRCDNDLLRLARYIYMLINEVAFDDALPEDPPITINESMSDDAGVTFEEGDGRIELNPHLLTSHPKRILDIVIHEMCHLAVHYLGTVDGNALTLEEEEMEDAAHDGHGLIWKAYGKKVRDSFKYVLRAPSVCHDYDVELDGPPTENYDAVSERDTLIRIAGILQHNPNKLLSLNDLAELFRTNCPKHLGKNVVLLRSFITNHRHAFSFRGKRATEASVITVRKRDVVELIEIINDTLRRQDSERTSLVKLREIIEKDPLMLLSPQQKAVLRKPDGLASLLRELPWIFKLKNNGTVHSIREIVEVDWLRIDRNINLYKEERASAVYESERRHEEASERVDNQNVVPIVEEQPARARVATAHCTFTADKALAASAQPADAVALLFAQLQPTKLAQRLINLIADENLLDAANFVYELLNRSVFDNKLPLAPPIRINPHLTAKSGDINGGEIQLSAKFLQSHPKRMLDTLAHQMCHFAVHRLDKLNNKQKEQEKRDNQRFTFYATKCKRSFPQVLDLPTAYHNYDASLAGPAGEVRDAAMENEAVARIAVIVLCHMDERITVAGVSKLFKKQGCWKRPSQKLLQHTLQHQTLHEFVVNHKHVFALGDANSRNSEIAVRQRDLVDFVQIANAAIRKEAAHSTSISSLRSRLEETDDDVLFSPKQREIVTTGLTAFLQRFPWIFLVDNEHNTVTSLREIAEINWLHVDRAVVRYYEKQAESAYSRDNDEDDNTDAIAKLLISDDTEEPSTSRRLPEQGDIEQ